MKHIYIAILTLFGFTNAETPLFNDIDQASPYYEAVQYLASRDIIHGYEDGLFRPENRINRAEFVKIVYGYRDTVPDKNNNSCFPDVQKEWYAPYVCSAKKDGFIEGYDDGMFYPEQYITLAEASQILVKTLKLPIDTTTTEVWYEAPIRALEAKNAIPIAVDTLDRPLRRDEVVEIMGRLMRPDKLYNTQTYARLSNSIGTFESCEQIEERLMQPGIMPQPRYAVDSMVSNTRPMMAADMNVSTKTTAAPMAEMESNNYSTTNIQVLGVDEGDTVKTDGKRIYSLQQEQLSIVNAIPSDDMGLLRTLTWPDFHPSEMYIDNDILTIVGTTNGFMKASGEIYNSNDTVSNNTAMAKMIMPPMPYYMPTTRVMVYDVKDMNAVKLIRSNTFEGSIVTSRMIDGMLYIVLNSYRNVYYQPIMPMVRGAGMAVPEWSDSTSTTQNTNITLSMPQIQEDYKAPKDLVACQSIRYFPGIYSSNYTIVAGIDTINTTTPIIKEVFLGESNNVYMSNDNLYIATNWYPQAMYSDWNMYSDVQKTRIYRFELKKDSIELEASGYVNGSILNQFSMDEYKDSFRIATTERSYNYQTQENKMSNNLYILDKNSLTTLSSLEDIAPDEQIYSVRYIGSRAYMVTFRQIDPLFVIDTSDVYAPKILGKLKIPGYSNYLHPYDDTHLIGFGKDALVGSYDTAYYQGMKISLFDVSNPEKPIENSSIIIGDRGTDSELLYNHKALLFDKEKGIIAFPINIAKITDSLRKEYLENGMDAVSIYGTTVWQGVQVYSINTKDGIKLLGEISHYTPEDYLKMGDYFPHDYYKTISRVLFIDNTYYTISPNMIQSTDRSTFKTQDSVLIQDKWQQQIPMIIE